MAGSTGSFIGGGILVLLLAGWLGQKYGLPPPPPKIAGIDLGTTYSSIGIYHAVTGETIILADDLGKKSIPSVVAFLPNGTVIVGSRAVEQQEHNPKRTIYDAKRFIGRNFERDNKDFLADQKRYPFKITLDPNGRAFFEIPLDEGTKYVYPEEIGAIIINYLKSAAAKHLGAVLGQVVISCPAEFNEKQRNFTGIAAEIAEMEVRRVISEPTAAALAYGLHKKQGVENVVVVDLGGGTLDVSVLWLQGGVFVTQAMAGNNRLGGQDFNERVQKHLIEKISEKFEKTIDDKEDIQQIRLEVEKGKIRLTNVPSTTISLNLKTVGKWSYELTREEFEKLNEDLLKSIELPIAAALEDAKKSANYGVDPELAVVTGASVQAGVIGGGWPLQVAAMELPAKRRKRHFFTEQQKENEQDRAAATEL
ncbi:Protein CBR-STC-1 [Caenorhabditis briggsae]|uniref:Heat shock 70 kDa protein 13 n=1 Tax=Caenorhabditis briggsae TaxID=6238 RepID=A8WNK7_CAEBR|nr:Protein CBR-STC-1 [Caenorhabditis briggsae]CAP22062.2 Protein CBR-STC-1 [Caenorhabditis briggsae]